MRNILPRRNEHMKKGDRSLRLLEILLRHVVPFEDHENLSGDFEEMHEIDGESICNICVETEFRGE